MRQMDYVAAVIRDMALLACVGGAIGWAACSSRSGLSFTCGCLWVALNFLLLACLVEVLTGPRRASRLFIFTLACAKIPASYCVLYWLFAVDYLEPVGLSIGLAGLPVALVFRALVPHAGGAGDKSHRALSA